MNIIKPRAEREIFNPPTRHVVVEATRKGVRQILRKHISKKPSRILEIGCGGGFLYRELVDSQMRENMFGIDNHELALRYFQQQSPRARLVCADIGSLPFPNKFFDTVVGFSAYSTISVPNALTETDRVIKGGGKLILFQDTGLSDGVLTVPSSSIEDRQRNLVESQEELAKALYKMGYKLHECLLPFSAAVAVPYEILKTRASFRERKDLISQTSDDILIGYARTPLMSDLIKTKPENARSKIAWVESVLDVPQKVISELKIEPGKSAFVFSQVPYIVAQKR